MARPQRKKELTWSGCNPDDGNRREAQLKGDKALWQPLFDKGACLRRHDRGKESGQEILNHLIDRSGKKMELDIQVEMVTYGKKLSETGAGKEVQEELDKLKLEYEKEMEEIRKEMQTALEKKDAERQEDLRENRAMIENQMQAARQEARWLEASREELRREMKEEHRREVEELRAEASKRERALEATMRQNTERHDQLTRELSTMQRQMNDSKIKDHELAELKAAAARREQALQESSKQNADLHKQMISEISAVKAQIARSKMKEGYNYTYKYGCPWCRSNYLYNDPKTTVDCNTIGCGRTFTTFGNESRPNSPISDTFDGIDSESDGSLHS
ncbi:MAG: hypothetical protein GOMPHAMPRED_000660 [Gomphillus americanus]|uniref:Uncharacterized protein n=1 Tax=Gomphillus americanus TaxID=1940652 RepID=A0A8H3F391_9LECA|nr:MAG: hypothetical protein GOMPHAMPRED_000660 [Gomphillus americanus]